MTFDLIAIKPLVPEAEYFHTGISHWPLYLRLMDATGLFDTDELEAMQINDGYTVCATKAWLAGWKLGKLEPTDFRLERTTVIGDRISIKLEDVKTFIFFLLRCGGFEVW